MDCAKVGELIRKLRKEKNMTQKEVADILNISNKTVSKWERGYGCPDSSLIPELSSLLNVDIRQMMEGEIIHNRPDIGNMERINFYVCPICNNILTSTTAASIFCCGRKLEPLIPVVNENTPKVECEQVDIDYYVKIDHPMERNHYILFIAYIKNDRIFITRMYPEQSPTTRIPYLGKGKLYIYCIKHGFTMANIIFN